MSGRYKSPKGTHNQKNYRTPPTPHQIRRQRARALTKHLATLVEHFPEYRLVIEDALSLVRYQTNRGLVLHAIRLGVKTVAEMQTATNLARPELRRYLNDLIESNILVTSKHHSKDPKGGPPTIHYRIKDAEETEPQR
jgi:hypothetical protein